MEEKNVPGGKGSLTNGGTHVPLIVNWRATVAEAQVTDTLVDFSDFLPTLADLGEAAIPIDLEPDGHSFAARLHDSEARSERTWAFAQGRNRFWVRDRSWKLYNDGSLFQLDKDPQEKAPLSPDLESRTATEARKRLLAAMKSL